MFAIHPDDLPVVVNQWNQVTTSCEDRIATVQYRVQNKQGVWEWIQQRTTILTRAENGTPQKLLVTLSIITERKQAEDEVHQLNAELEQRVQARTAQLEAANQELEAFSYSISHDLRAPLRAIDGFSRILLEDYSLHLEAEAQRYLNIVRDNAQQMGYLIDDLLTFSRLSRQPLHKQTVDVESLV
jgi:signal transduction histidine kinase